MALKPDPNNYRKGESDKEYKRQIEDMELHPENWNQNGPDVVPSVMSPIPVDVKMEKQLDRLKKEADESKERNKLLEAQLAKGANESNERNKLLEVRNSELTKTLQMRENELKAIKN